MIIVDEYDSSVNSAIFTTAEPFRKFLSDRSSSYFKFFTSLKAALKKPENHALVVGVTPLAISDFTSGFNIAVDITWDERYQDVCGVTTLDIGPILQKIADDHRFNRAVIEQRLRNYYDGYHFGGSLGVFNSGQLVNCLEVLSETGEFPSRLTDINTNLSESVFRFLSNGENFMFFEILMKLLTTTVPFNLQTSFDIDTLRKELDEGSSDTLLSLMVYYGALTVDINKDINGTVSKKIRHVYSCCDVHCHNATFGTYVELPRPNPQQRGSCSVYFSIGGIHSVQAQCRRTKKTSRCSGQLCRKV